MQRRHALIAQEDIQLPGTMGTGMINQISAKLWEETRSLAPIVAAAQAFAERDIYRLLLPEDLGGRGLPVRQVSRVSEAGSKAGSGSP